MRGQVFCKRADVPEKIATALLGDLTKFSACQTFQLLEKASHHDRFAKLQQQLEKQILLKYTTKLIDALKSYASPKVAFRILERKFKGQYKIIELDDEKYWD